MNDYDIDNPDELLPSYDLGLFKELGFEPVWRANAGKQQQWSKKLAPGGWLHVERRSEMPGQYYIHYVSPSHRDFNKGWWADSNKLAAALRRLVAIFDKPINVVSTNESLMEAKLPDVLIDLHDLFMAVKVRPVGPDITFHFVVEGLNFSQAHQKVVDFLNKHQIAANEIMIVPGKEDRRKWNRAVTLRISKSALIPSGKFL